MDLIAKIFLVLKWNDSNNVWCINYFAHGKVTEYVHSLWMFLLFEFHENILSATLLIATSDNFWKCYKNSIDIAGMDAKLRKN